MSKFEVLCVTMNQKDFSKIKEMNINSNVVFANQCDRTSYDEYEFGGHTAKMISTQTRGVGINRNLALMYASAEICLLADDDIRYVDNYSDIVTKAFKKQPKADIIIFNIDSNSSERKIAQIANNHWLNRYSRNPFGGPRIAVKLSSIRKKNLWFTSLFGGGAHYPSGEDSMFILSALRKRCKIYCSSELIGTVSFDNSTWFSGFDEKFFIGKGAFYCANYPRLKHIWMIYFALRTSNMTKIKFTKKVHLLLQGMKEYNKLSN